MNRSFVGVLLLAPMLSCALPAQHADPAVTALRSPEEERALLRVPPGFEVQLVAAEPDIQKPFNLAFDARGRVWATGSSLYPWPARRDALGDEIAGFREQWDDNPLAFRALAATPEPPEMATDTVRVLSDFGPDGRARKVEVFADGLNIPIGICPLPREPGARGDTVIVFSIPAIWRLTDSDGDGRADVRAKLYDGFGFRDTHGMSSSYWHWYDGWIYGTHGFANTSEVRDREGRVVKLSSGNTYRFRPDGSRFEIYSHGQTNPFGLAFDPRGELYTADSHSKPVYLLQPGGYYEGIGTWNAHDGLGFAPAMTDDTHGSSAIAGVAHYAAPEFPVEYQDNLFNGNPVTRRVNRVRLDWAGSTPFAVRQPDFVASDDPAFRPVQVKQGPDGALWIADFYNPIIGHYEAPLTHPARDRTHGRIWRVVWRGAGAPANGSLLPDLTSESTTVLGARLRDPNAVVRSLAVAELLARPDAASVIPGLTALAAGIVDGTDRTTDATVLLPVEIVLARLGAVDDRRLQQALQRGEGAVAQAALRAQLARDELPPGAEQIFGSYLEANVPDRSARLIAGLYQRHPQPWQAPQLLSALARVRAHDTQARYALRLALKAQVERASFAEMKAWSKRADAYAELIADAGQAVTTPAVAEFILDHALATAFAGERTGEQARHAVRLLPARRLAVLAAHFPALDKAPAAQRLALAEGLADVAGRKDDVLPGALIAWTEAQLVALSAEKSPALLVRVAGALKVLEFPRKQAVIRRLAGDDTLSATVRGAALRALTPATPDAEGILAEFSGTGRSAGLRRVAVQMLGEWGPSSGAIDALTNAFADAPADLAVATATALARNDDGAARLLALVQDGRVPATVLQHRYVGRELERRSTMVRERAARLTRALPPEAARLDAAIADRQLALATLKPDRERGRAVFAQHCAACHRLGETGGTLGPNLDAAGHRDTARLLEDILDPNRNVDPTFRLSQLVLRSGETRSGLDLRESAGTVAYTDPATNTTITVPAGEVASHETSDVSAMPAIFETALSAQDLADLIGHLRSFTNKP